MLFIQMKTFVPGRTCANHINGLIELHSLNSELMEDIDQSLRVMIQINSREIDSLEQSLSSLIGHTTSRLDALEKKVSC